MTFLGIFFCHIYVGPPLFVKVYRIGILVSFFIEVRHSDWRNLPWDHIKQPLLGVSSQFHVCSKILQQSGKMMNLYRCIMSTVFSVIFQQRAGLSGKYFFPGHKLFKCGYDAGSYNLWIPPTNKILNFRCWSKITIIFSHRNFDFLKELWYL